MEKGPFRAPLKHVTPLPRAGFGPEVSVGLWTLMHRSTGTDTPLLLFLPSVPSGAAAETEPTKVVREISCKIEGWRGKERRRDGRRLLEAERGKREKKRSLVLVPFPPALPTERRKNLPSSHCSPRRTQPGHPTEMVTTPSPRTLRTPAVAKHRPWHFKPSSWDTSPHQPAPPARDFNPWSSKQHPSSPSGFHYPLQRTKGGSPPPSNPP